MNNRVRLLVDIKVRFMGSNHTIPAGTLGEVEHKRKHQYVLFDGYPVSVAVLPSQLEIVK